MSFTSIIRLIFFNLGALAVAYVLLLSGVHKFTYKVRQGGGKKEGRAGGRERGKEGG